MPSKSQVNLGIVINANGQAVVRETKRIDKQMRAFQSGVRNTTRFSNLLTKSLIGVGAAVGVFYTLQRAARALSTQLNQLQNAANRLKVVTENSQQLADVQQKLFALAQQNRVGWLDLHTIYSRLAIATSDLNVGQERLLAVTSAVSKAAVIGGASTQELRGGLIQLSQGLAAGELRGEEFRSVMENMPVLMRTIAKSFGTTIGGLRDLRDQGKLTTEAIIAAIEKGTPAINEDFEKTSSTIEQSITKLQDSVKLLINEFDKIEDASGAAVSGIDRITDAIQRLAKGIKQLPEYQRLSESIFSGSPQEQQEAVDLLLFRDPNYRFGHLDIGGAQAYIDAVPQLRQGIFDEIEELAAYMRSAEFDGNTGKALKRMHGLNERIHQLGENAEELHRYIRFLENEPPLKIEIESPNKPGGGSETDAPKGKTYSQKDIDKLIRELNSTGARNLIAAGSIGGTFANTSYLAQRQERAWRDEREQTKAIKELLQEVKDNPISNLVAAGSIGGTFANPEQVFQAQNDAMLARVERMNEKLAEEADKLAEIEAEYKQLSQTIAQDFVDSIRTGADMLEFLGRTLERVLDRVYEKLVVNPLGDLLFQGIQAFAAGFSGGGASHANPISGYSIGPGAASGGRVARSGLVRVGEAGPELVALPTGAEIYPRGDLASGERGNTIINVNGVNDPVTIENAIRRASAEIEQNVISKIQVMRDRPGGRF